MHYRKMPLSTRLIKAIKWLVAWIVLIIYYLKTGNFAEYDIWNAVGISLPFYIAMYRIFFNNVEEMISPMFGIFITVFYPVIEALLNRDIESLKDNLRYVGAVLLCISETFFLDWLLLKILPIIG